MALICSGDDLVFGDYQTILADAALWDRLGWQMAQPIFVDKLDQVRKIGNEVMHYRPDPLSPDSMRALENFAKWLRSLDHCRDRRQAHSTSRISSTSPNVRWGGGPVYCYPR